ncbi:MAG: helix-turn-helix domain-containing protein [Thermodesulfobacteriota bacterium]
MSTFKERLTLLIGDEEKPYGWAKRIGLPGATFNRMWQDGTPPKWNFLVMISEKTGVSIEWLLTGEGPAVLKHKLDKNAGLGDLLIRLSQGFMSSQRKSMAHHDLEEDQDDEKRVIPYGRRRTDQPFSEQMRRVINGLLYLEKEDHDSFMILSGKIVEMEKEVRKNEDLKKMGNHNA